MFPLAHVYAIGRLVPGPGPLHVLGAIFPDAVLTNSLAWEQTHRSGAALYAFLRGREPAGLPFAVGMISHGCTPPGLDYYGDEQYGSFERGYSFEEARPYADRVAEVCRLPAEMGWWKAHNFVEMALEWLLARRDPSLGRQLHEAFATAAEGPDAHPPLARLVPCLAAFFGQDGDSLLHSLPAMAPFLAMGEMTPDILAERYQRQVRLKHGVEAIEVGGAAALIEEIAVAIQPRCWAFLEDVLAQIQAMLRQEGWDER